MIKHGPKQIILLLYFFVLFQSLSAVKVLQTRSGLKIKVGIKKCKFEKYFVFQRK